MTLLRRSIVSINRRRQRGSLLRTFLGAGTSGVEPTDGVYPSSFTNTF
jgi:hypothetical protein